MSSTSVTGAAMAGGRHAQGPAGGRLRGRVLWIAGTAVAGAALFAAYLLQSRTVSVGSDGASQALQAWDMLHGNPLLHGWWVTDVSFYTTELPQYMLIEAARGLSSDVMHIGGAMSYTLLVLLAAFLARGRARGAAGLTRALVAAGIMLAPQLGSGTGTLVLSPDHTGTGVPVLLVLLLIDLAPARWWVPVLAGLGLAVTVLADAMALFVVVIPLALVCAIRVFQGIVRHGERLRDRWYELSLGAAAVVSVPVEMAATALIRAHGGWQVHGLRTALAGGAMLPGNLRLTGEGLLELFGADFIGAGSARAVVFALIHLAGVVLVGTAFCVAVRRFFRRDMFIEPVLVLGIVIDVGAYVAGVQAVNMLSTREIAPVLPFAAVLAGRLAGMSVARLKPLRYGLAAVLVCYAGMLGYAAAQPAAAPQYADLTAWLTSHHLTSGISGYSQANIVTASSGGTVSLRPVAAGGSGGKYVTARTWNASSTWFDPAKHHADFLVLSTFGAYEVSGADAVATFGRPARVYRYRDYTIMVWHENLLARLR
ncbi:MAG TPA: hypothetical protein VKG80_11380 [Trebonia sp.]|nr:hypothetical protein [Trebonia sp.]